MHHKAARLRDRSGPKKTSSGALLGLAHLILNMTSFCIPLQTGRHRSHEHKVPNPADDQRHKASTRNTSPYCNGFLLRTGLENCRLADRHAQKMRSNQQSSSRPGSSPDARLTERALQGKRPCNQFLSKYFRLDIPAQSTSGVTAVRLSPERLPVTA